MTIDQQATERTLAPRVDPPPLDEENMVGRRVTIGLVPRVRAELKSLMDRTQFSLTDVVNRAVSIYYLVNAHQNAGYELVFRHRETGKERVVEIL
uniref:hypothetical protein n=1 Tax=Actinoplanes sp. CA-151224 TaxID=3239904 RepID=UPI003F496507